MACLDTNTNLCLDFYFNNAEGHIFTFSYRPVGYHVMSIPYGLLSMDQIKSFIGEFDILNAWGAGEDSPPPDTVEEIEAASDFASSPFLRFRNGTYLLGNNQVS